MLKIDKFYYKYGIRKLYHFLDPITINSKELFFPKYSAFHFYKLSDLPTGPNKDIPYFKFLKTPLIFTAKEYHNPIGMTKVNASKLKNYFKKTKKEASDFKFLNLNVKTLRVKPNQLLIYNYGILSPSYRYGINVLNRYYKWANRLSTIVNTINDFKSDEMSHFITFTIPKILPSRVLLDKHVNRISKVTLERFADDRELNVLELWKLLTPDEFNNSILGKINKKKIANTYLFLEIDDKVTIMSLEVLLSAVSEYNIHTKIKKHGYKKIQKLLYIMLTKIISGVPLSLSEIENYEEKLVDKYLNNKGLSLQDKIASFDDNTTDTVIDTKIDLDGIIDDNHIEDDVEVDVDIEDLGEVKLHDDIIDDEIDLPYDNMEELLNEDLDDKDNLLNSILEYNNNNLITNNESTKLLNILEEQDSLPDPYGGKLKVKDMKIVTKEDLSISKEDTVLPDNELIIDKTMLSNKIEVMDSKYIDNVYKKDMVSSIYSLQNNNVIVEDYKIEVTESILGKIEEHTMVIKPISGRKSTVRFKLPVIESDGTFKMSGHNYKMRKQRTNVPIKKLSESKVALTSYYGKLFVTKSKYKKNDLSSWIVKQLVSLSAGNPELKNITLIDDTIPDIKLPEQYTMFNKRIKSFVFNKSYYYFGYHDRDKLLKDLKLEDIEKKKYILVGMLKQTPLVMDKDNIIYTYSNGIYKEHIRLIEALGIDMNLAPLEFSSVKLFKKEMPVGLLLTYYLGFDNLISLLRCKSRILTDKKRYLVEDGEYIIRFKDKRYVLNRSDKIATMILAGIFSLDKYTKQVPIATMNNRDNMLSFFNLLDLPILYINEIKLLEDMFVDPITKTTLISMKEPTNFKGLLVRSSELLTTDHYTHPNNIETSLIKGYERVPGMVYNEMIGAIRDFNNKSMYGKSSIKMNSYNIWKNIGNDSATVLVDDLNPLASLKQSEDVTYSGMLGLTSQTLSKVNREVHPSEIGTISEATKDSGDVGLTSYLTADPNLISLRGQGKVVDKGSKNLTGLLSTVGMLSPGTTNDVSKRLK